MLKTLFGKSLGSSAEDESPSEKVSPDGIGLDRIKTLIDFFPIGKKLRYYPEFKKEIVFDTFVVAYCVNGKFVYSGESIDRDGQGVPTAFHVGEQGERIPASGLKLLQLLVPDTSDLEMKLDYQSRAVIGRGRQFKKGNYISLISSAGGRGVAAVDTVVAKPVDLPDGPYAHTKMVLLTPEMETLNVTDQRRKARAKTSAPVKVFLAEGNLSGVCTIVDISDSTVRVRVRDRDTSMPAMREGDEVILDIDLGEAERHYTLKGSVIISRSAETCVIQLTGLLKDDKFGPCGPLDLLELKAGLLNYSQ